MKAVELGIKTKKVVYKGKKFYKILEFGCYGFDDLPFEYFDQYPFCFKADVDGAVVIFAGNKDEDAWEINVGDLLDIECFDKILKIIRHCGHKLHDINLKIKEIKKEWHGEEEFKI